MYNIQYTIHNTQYTIYNIQYTISPFSFTNFLRHVEGIKRMYNTLIHVCVCVYIYIYIYIYIGFKTFFYVVRHLDSVASYLPIGLHLGFFGSWPSLYLPSSFSSVFLVHSFVSVCTSVLFLVIFLLPFSEHGSTM